MAIKALIDIASNQNAAPAPRVAAATAILDRGWGKPAASLTVDATVRRPAVELTDDDLAAVAASSGIGADTAEDDPAEPDDVV
jgi:hypothetical protein